MRDLNLGKNFLATLPREIVQMKNLKTLDLTENFFFELPHIIGKLDKLQRLNFPTNYLKKFPGDLILQLKNLNCIAVGNNPFDDDPEEFNRMIDLLGKLKLKDILVHKIILKQFKTDFSRKFPKSNVDIRGFG